MYIPSLGLPCRVILITEFLVRLAESLVVAASQPIFFLCYDVLLTSALHQ